MKKNGFTLAEVLITLAIIGVVASLTLPSLLVNTGEQQYITAYKKAINTLSEAGQLNLTLSGFDYSSLTATDTETADGQGVDAQGNVIQSLWGLLRARTNIVRTDAGILTDSNTTVFFKDGTSIEYTPGDTVETDGNKSTGFCVVLDLNGNKGPNVFSNCEGNGAKTTVNDARGGLTGDGDTVDSCNTKANRMIKDKFTIRLRDGHAEPFDAAGQWVTQH